jgi:hypothetical protein
MTTANSDANGCARRAKGHPQENEFVGLITGTLDSPDFRTRNTCFQIFLEARGAIMLRRKTNPP